MLLWQEVLYDLSGDAFSDRRSRSELITYDGDPMPRQLVNALVAAFTDASKLTEYRRAVSLAVLPRLEIAGPPADNAADPGAAWALTPELAKGQPAGALPPADVALGEIPERPAV